MLSIMAIIVPKLVINLLRDESLRHLSSTGGEETSGAEPSRSSASDSIEQKLEGSVDSVALTAESAPLAPVALHPIVVKGLRSFHILSLLFFQDRLNDADPFHLLFVILSLLALFDPLCQLRRHPRLLHQFLQVLATVTFNPMKLASIFAFLTHVYSFQPSQTSVKPALSAMCALTFCECPIQTTVA